MKRLSLCVMALTALSNAAYAGGGSLFGTSTDKLSGTYYMGAGIGKTNDNGCDSTSSINDNINTASNTKIAMAIDCSSTNAWKAYAGYRLSPTIALEGAYVKFGEHESSLQVANSATTADHMSIKSKANGLNVSGVASAPLSDSLNLFGKMGALFWKNKTNVELTENSTTVGKGSLSQDGTDVSLGAGAEYKVNDNWGIRGEYEHFNGLDANMYSVGATFSSF